MGVNVGAIFVQAGRGVDAARVADGVTRYWRSKGARPDNLPPLGLKPLDILEKKSKRLGVAIAPAAQGWIGVRDSERYFADYSLARQLSKSLGARVCWFAISDASDSAILQVLDKGKPTEAVEGASKVAAAIRRLKIPGMNIYFEDLLKKKSPGCTLLSFSPVVASKYDSGPEASGEDEDEEDDGPPPDPKFAAWHERLDQGFLLQDREWEKALNLDDKFLPQICRLAHRALEGKEARPDVLIALMGKAIEGKDRALFKTILERAPGSKAHPIDRPSLMWRLGTWLNNHLFKGSFPADWTPAVEKWIKAALPHAARVSDIHAVVAMAYARLGAAGKSQEQIRLAIRTENFYGSGLAQDPVVAPILKKKPFAEEVARLLEQFK